MFSECIKCINAYTGKESLMLSIKNLTKVYKIKGGNDTLALDKVNIDFPEKGMVFLLGKSGSGKSTLLNLIGGLDFPSDGEIILKGRSSKDFSQSDFDSYRNTYIGFIFQEYNILNEFNVEQNIALAIELQGKKVSKEAVESLLEQVDLTGYGKRKPNTLSGGQKQRIAIARALIKEPNIIMADEPTGALDSKTGEQVFETLKKLSADKLVIVVSHDRDFAERFGDRIIELKDGKILSDQTKHLVESTPISDNVTIINEHAIKINDAKKLTKKDFDQLYESIKNSDGKVFISSGENADKSMKVARISEDGKSDEFKETDKIELKQYDASKTTFIRSKMPINKSTKMGLSSLKTKPVRLVFTMLLSVISFTMFGVASALMLYSPSHTYSEALKTTDYTSERLSKHAKGKQIDQSFDENGNMTYESSYQTTEQTPFGVEEIKKLNNNKAGLVYIPIGELGSPAGFQAAKMKNKANFYGTYYRIKYLSDASEEDFNKLEYHLDGKFPVNKDEVLLPKVFGEMLVDSGYFSNNNYLELIGQKISFNISKLSNEMLISGFYDAGEVDTKYFEICNETTNLNQQEINNLKEDLNDYFTNSFNSVAFVNKECYEKTIGIYNTGNNNNHYVNSYYRRGIRIGEKYVTEYEVSTEESSSCFTDETLKTEGKYFKFFDLNGNPIENVTINSGEAYLSYMYANEVAFRTRTSLLNFFFDLPYGGSNMIRYMPTYQAFCSSNEEMIDQIRMGLWNGEVDECIDFFNSYKEEFNKACKIELFIHEYCSSENFNNLAQEDKQLFNKALGSNNGALTSEEIDAVYQILDNNFDKADACKNYLPSLYLDTVCTYIEEIRDDIMYNHSDIKVLLNKDYHNWSDSDVTLVINYLNEHCQGGLSLNGDWQTKLKGYTFKDYEPTPESVFKVDNNAKLYYKTYSGESGEITIAGFYESDRNNNYTFFLNKAFLDSLSLEDDYNRGSTWYSEFVTKYQKPADERYGYVMVKSNFSEEQIRQMLKCEYANAEYRLNSIRYQSVSFIVEMINTLKNIFLWTGVAFGVFAALMMLNFITVSIASKQKDIGILRAIGARKSDVFKIFFAESLFIATVCSVLSLIFTVTAEFFLDRYFVSEIGISIMQFSLATVGLVIAVSLVIAVIATIIPVLHSSKKPPVESIRAL